MKWVLPSLSFSKSKTSNSVTSVQFSRSVVSNSLRHHGLQHTRPPCPSPIPKEFTQTHVHWVGDAIQPSHPLSSPSPPAPNPSQHQSFPMSQLFAWGGQSTGVSALASFPPKSIQGWSPLEWTAWISSRDSQESSATPQFKCINSSALSFLHSPALTSIYDHRKLQSDRKLQGPGGGGGDETSLASRHLMALPLKTILYCGNSFSIFFVAGLPPPAP